jgi:hypothetical protein
MMADIASAPEVVLGWDRSLPSSMDAGHRHILRNRVRAARAAYRTIPTRSALRALNASLGRDTSIGMSHRATSIDHQRGPS